MFTPYTVPLAATTSRHWSKSAFIVQLRYGCDSPSCTTSSCLSCRKRIAGKAPIRRYNPTSARTLAVYLASQDNPENALCPYVRIGKDTPVSGPSSLVFTPVHLPQNAVDSKRTGRRLSNTLNDDANGECPSGTPHHEPSTSCRRVATFEVSEQPVRYDHRSFAANVFGTAAFKMLEWLAPQGFEGLTKKAQAMSISTPTTADNEPGVEHGEPPTRALSRQGEDSGTVISQPRNEKAGPKEDGTAGQSLLGGGQDPTDEQMTSPEDSAEEDVTDSHSSEDDFGDGRLCARLAAAKTPKDSRKPVVEVDDDGKEGDTETSMIDAALLPQTLGRLNLEIIEFLFSVLREDSTSELPLVPARGNSWQLQAGKYRRMPVAPHPYPMSMKIEWKRFVEQSVFYVMSDPHSLVRSFTQDGKLVDSRNLWRCMVRLTDSTPSLVFHSLWISISGLFILPKHLQPAQLAGEEGREELQESNVLNPLLNQMDFLNSDTEIGQDSSPMPQALPILLLDWARAVIMQEWDGHAVFNPDSAFGGAVLFIEAMCRYERRQELLLADVNFRLDYVADRLDSATVPVDWLTFEASRKSQHLLDRPFLFNPSHLVNYFRAVNLARMSRSYEEPSSVYERVRRLVTDGLVTHAHRKLMQDMLRRTTSKYLILNVSRNTELVRPLKVHLGEDSGEEGFDLGGVQQEFFKLAFAQIFDPNYGAFQVDDRTRMAWFVPGSLLETWKYELIGVLFSLAVYNGITLPVTLPKAFYRRLLGEPVDELHHIADGWPDLASGLTTLLEWDEKDGSVEDVFARTYEFSIEVFDAPVSRNMQAAPGEAWPRVAVPSDSSAPTAFDQNPTDAPMVTYDNRSAYVSDYIKYLTDISVRPQYEAFERGFKACLTSKSLNILNSTILQSIVEGMQEIDLSELKRYTRYNGWDASHSTIKDFWSIVKRYDEPMKRRLLEFVTASDRVPVGGMQNIQFVIQRNGEEGPLGRLPTAYTCYGTLLLPEYQDKEVLKERMGMALQNAQGFGFG
ncbi:unnamed protein product [Parascedosporium putredinis]|uniref:HECT-type E3 ubiquitin transferase n=1 Tax=Parascedosporium putredinis TaxID=1442378 RepID=A0A9P1MD79_9PEZI|nr:unnamed protein product [Parascedosporium putredinis]CAI7999927.1 unnamed protein product [Parascedosporium putredinis]